jgi:hypothetical protein
MMDFINILPPQYPNWSAVYRAVEIAGLTGEDQDKVCFDMKYEKSLLRRARKNASHLPDTITIYKDFLKARVFDELHGAIVAHAKGAASAPMIAERCIYEAKMFNSAGKEIDAIKEVFRAIEKYTLILQP